MPLDDEAPLLLPAQPIPDLDTYVATGGGAALDLARQAEASSLFDQLDAAGIRGRGGAGFPAGQKWRSIASAAPSDGDRFVVANGAEGEPASFKDRMLMRRNPYQVLEGLLVAAHAVQAREAFVALKGSFDAERAAMQRALDEASSAGWVDRPVHLVAGPDEYLFGEEKAMLEVIEGEDPLPRMLPPYQYGLFSASPNLGWSANLDRSSSGPSNPSANPTLVNNVETLAAVAAALRIGPERYRHRPNGTPILVTVCGDTVRAGVAEVGSSTTLGDAIEVVGGGLEAGRSLKAVLSGVANPVLGPDATRLPLTYDAFAGAGSGLGAAGFWVLDDTADMVAVAEAVAWFLHVESCGQCSPCKLGTGAIASGLHEARRLGAAWDGSGQLVRALETVTDGARCGLALQARLVVWSILAAYPDEVASAAEGGAPAEVPPPVPKIVDLVEGRAILDSKQQHKRPDWTRAEQPVRIDASPRS